MKNMTRESIKGSIGHSSVNRNELAKKVFPESNKGLRRVDKARLEAYRAKKQG